MCIRDSVIFRWSPPVAAISARLGVVELTLALYQTLDLDRDRVIWDVGHQAYPHKLITGRFQRLPYPSPAERSCGLPQTLRKQF